MAEEKYCSNCKHWLTKKDEEPCGVCKDNNKWISETSTCMYVVIGYQKMDDGHYHSDIYGVFSTDELAVECAGYITEELEFLSHVEIEEVPLDEFGYR